MQLLKALWALAGAALCCFLVLVIHAQFLKEGNCPRRAERSLGAVLGTRPGVQHVPPPPPPPPPGSARAR